MVSSVGYSHLRPMTRKWCIWHSRRGWILVSRRLRLCLWCHARDWLATNRGSQSCNLCFGRSLARGGGRLCLGNDLTKKRIEKIWNGEIHGEIHRKRWCPSTLFVPVPGSEVVIPLLLWQVIAMAVLLHMIVWVTMALLQTACFLFYFCEKLDFL